MILETFPEFFAGALAVADLVYRYEIQVALGLNEFYELLFADFAHRALIGSLGTFVNVTAYGTTPFLCHNLSNV